MKLDISPRWDTLPEWDTFHHSLPACLFLSNYATFIVNLFFLFLFQFKFTKKHHAAKFY